MARNENPPFPRGQTFVNGAYTISSTDLPGLNIEGKTWVFEDLDYGTSGAKAARTNHDVLCVAARNVASFAIRPKSYVTFQETAGVNYARIDGMCDVTAERVAGAADEFMSSTGCVQYDICWVVLEGPAVVLTDIAASANNLIPVGTIMVALTAASSGATTAGRGGVQDLTGATAVLGAQLQHRIGRAMSAKTTNNTNADILVMIGRF